MVWTVIANSEIDADSPITTSLMTAFRDNVASALNQDSGAPSYAAASIPTASLKADLGITEPMINWSAMTGLMQIIINQKEISIVSPTSLTDIGDDLYFSVYIPANANTLQVNLEGHRTDGSNSVNFRINVSGQTGSVSIGSDSYATSSADVNVSSLSGWVTGFVEWNSSNGGQTLYVRRVTATLK